MSNTTRHRSHERHADNAILNTLSYRAVFNYPMSYFQLNTYMITSRLLDREQLHKSLKKLLKQGDISVKNQKYHTKGIKPVSWDQRAKNTKETFQALAKAITILQMIPWIKLIAITGSAAAHNMDKKDDMDIFIVSGKRRLWLTRGFTAIILKALGKYFSEKDQAQKLCPNLLVDETAMAWNPKSRNVYVAHEIVMMHPIVNKDDTYFKFLKKNDWAYNYFAMSKPDFLEEFKFKEHSPKRSKLLDKLETIAMNAQLRIMAGKKTKEITEKNFIHFNKNDWTEKIMGGYQANIKR